MEIGGGEYLSPKTSNHLCFPSKLLITVSALKGCPELIHKICLGAFFNGLVSAK